MKNRQIIILIYLQLGIMNNAFLAQTESTSKNKEWEIFPIINYDSDLGFGYGGKGFLYNFLETGESFDLTIFNSTKGERWYQLIFSSPDIQRRQGKKYNFAFDLILDYDKYIQYTYYRDKYYWLEGDRYLIIDSIGNVNPAPSEEQYIREPIELRAIFSRAFTSDFIAELGVQYRSISCYGFEEAGALKYVVPSHVEHFSVLFNFRIDTRNNFINPGRGVVLQIGNEYARSILESEDNFYKLELLFQGYFPLIIPEIISATRIKLQTLSETSYQNLLFLGGNSTLRGIPQSRYLSQSAVLLNQEFRFPIWWRLGGIAALDIGNSTSTPNWILNPVAGLRFNMDNFIVRFDVGFGSEYKGIYFNFGHLF